MSNQFVRVREEKVLRALRYLAEAAGPVHVLTLGKAVSVVQRTSNYAYSQYGYRLIRWARDHGYAFATYRPGNYMITNSGRDALRELEAKVGNE